MEYSDAHAPAQKTPEHAPETGDTSGPRRRTPRWLKGIYVVLGLTFVLGFYVPLLSANQTLSKQFLSLSKEYAQATQAFEETSRELAKEATEKNEFKAELSDISQAASSESQAIDELYAELLRTLKLPIERKQFSVKKGKRSVSVVIDSLHLVYPHKTFVHAQGAELLCQMARSIPKHAAFPTQVVAHQNGIEPSSRLLAKQFVSSWQLSSMMASEVALAIEKCGVAGTQLRAVGAAHFEGNPRDAKKSVARFEIFIYPKAS